MVTATKTTDWKPIFITLGMSILSGVITGIIFVMTMKGDIRVLTKSLDDYKDANNIRLLNIEKEAGELRIHHYQMAAKQVEQDNNLKNVTRSVNPVLIASRVKPVELQNKVLIEPLPQVATEVKKKELTPKIAQAR
jgi:ABC-type lipoprotein release transport system permease subunit